MATPKTVTDASSDLDEAVLNLFLRAGKLQVKVNYAVIAFTAAGNTVAVSGSFDSDGEIVTGDTSWDAGDVRIEITITGFTAVPVVLGGIITNSSTNIEKARFEAISSSVVAVTFLSNATPGAATDPDGDMTVNLFLIGV